MYGLAQDDINRLSTQLRHIQSEFDRARARGDFERISRARIQMSAIIAERDRLMRHLSALMIGAGRVAVR